VAISREAAHYRAIVASRTKKNRDSDNPDDTDRQLVNDAKRGLAVTLLAEHAKRLVADWPALPEEQIDRVAAILRGGGN